MNHARRIQAGTYKARGIAGSEQHGTTSNGHDQIVIGLDLFELGEKLSTFLVFTDKSASFAIDRLRALGWKGTDLCDLRGIDSADVDVEVRYEMYQGQEKMKVEIRTSGGVVLKDKLDDKGKRAFAAKYAALAKSAAPPPSAQRTQAPPPANEGVPDAGDLPF